MCKFCENVIDKGYEVFQMIISVKKFLKIDVKIVKNVILYIS